MAEGSILTGDLTSHVLDGLFDSFGKKSISDDVYVQNYDDVDKLKGIRAAGFLIFRIGHCFLFSAYFTNITS